MITTNSMIITRHAKDRMKERCGFNKRASTRMAEKALQSGICHSQLSGGICRWVNKLYLSQRNANNIKIYGNQAYLFKDTVLITVIQVPAKFLPELKNIREKAKNGKAQS